MTISVMLVDDQQVILDSLTELIKFTGIGHVVAAELEGNAAISKALELRPDLLLIDVSLPDMNGIEITRQLVRQWPEVRILAVSAHADPVYVRRMLKAGALGYLLKDNATREIKSAIQAVMDGGTWITGGLSTELA